MKKRFFTVLLIGSLIAGVIPALSVSAVAASVSNTDISSLVATANGAVGKTAAQLGIPTSGWCGHFVGYCINNSSISARLGTIPSDASKFSISPAAWVCITKDAGVYYSFSSAHSARLGEISSAGKIVSSSSSTFTPMVGDLVEFTWKAWSVHEFSHVGIVTAVNGNTITYVDGNSQSGKGKVASHTMDKSNTSIIGYIRFDQSADNSAVIIPDGTYTLAPQCAPTSRLDVRGGSTASKVNIQIHQANNSDAQSFNFTHVGDGYYEIVAKVSGKALDVYNGNTTSGTNVWQFDRNSSDAQKWLLEDAGDGCYYIVPKVNTGLCLDVYNGGTANGSNVQIWNKNQSNAQKWKIVSLDGTPAKPITISNGLPSNLTIRINPISCNLNTPVRIEPSANNVTHYAVSIWLGKFQTGEKLYTNYNFQDNIVFTPSRVGMYTVRIDAKNGAGYISEETTFTVSEAPTTNTAVPQKTWGAWSTWSSNYAVPSDTRQVETRSVKVSDSRTEYRYGRYIDSTGQYVSWCPTYLENRKAVTGNAILQYSDWSAERYGTSGSDWTCGYCKGAHSGVHHYSSDGRAWWVQYVLSSGNYYWEETRTVDAVYETQYRYRDLR